jgi:hypothetical protein
MPMIDLYFQADAITEQASLEAVEKLTAALLRHEGAPDNEQTRAMSRAFLHELLRSPSSSVAARPLSRRTVSSSLRRRGRSCTAPVPSAPNPVKHSSGR